MRAWAALGLFSGLSMLTKYSALVQFATFFLYMLIMGQLREARTWRGIGVAAGVFLAIMTPHLLWLTGQHAGERGGPIGYAAHSLSASMTRAEHFGVLIDFFTTSLGRVAAMGLALVVIFAWNGLREKAVSEPAVAAS